MTTKAIGDVVKITKGKKVDSTFEFQTTQSTRYIQIDDLRNDNNLKYTNDKGVQVTKNDVIIAWDGANAGTIGYGLAGTIGSTLAKLEIKDNEIIPSYLGRVLQNQNQYLRAHCTGATIPHISRDILNNIQIPKASLNEQKKIANTLDQADALRQKRKQTINLLNEYIKSVFLEIFGDPVSNPKNWEITQLADVCIRLSDGPFGSKLKSEHYVKEGIRVIRLQNIGVNKFVDKDKAYISTDYYEKELYRYTCKAGDIVIATLGDPNIRACLIPDFIKVAVNKADCVHCVPNQQRINSTYLVTLLNHSRFQHVFLNLVHGQTRGRISSGQLKQVLIPIPSMELQNKFAKIVQDTEIVKQKMLEQLLELENQFQALMQKYFSPNYRRL